MVDIGRRGLIMLIGGAAGWPLVARAQQPAGKVAQIGFLHSATAEAYALMTAAFRNRLSESGNVTIEYRWAAGRLERLPELAADLVRRQVSAIFAGGGLEPAIAAKAATSQIPIVFATGGDPVKAGLVESLNRPGGNITGVTFLVNALGPKELEILRQLQPKATVIAALLNPNLVTTASQSRDVQAAASALGLEVYVVHASTEDDIEGVFASIAQKRITGMLVGADAFLFSHRNQLVRLAAHYSVATVYPWREAVLAGGLASYGTNITDAYALAGIFTARILKGDKPAELPVQQSIKTEFVLNLKTARALQLDVSSMLSALADEVIE
jgi:putative tryptophan/tyrosine transport system substrate-binding protein